MSCCGNKRNAWHRIEAVHSYKTSLPNSSQKDREEAYFEYTGESALSITGPVSGKKYRFLFKGDRQLADYRDASGMMAVPVLKRVRTQ